MNADPTLGTHCAVDICHQLDFLPFTCDKCHQVFCLAHRTYQDHECNFDRTQVNVLPDCPICGKTIKVKANENPDHIMDVHIRSNCTANLVQEKKKRMCNLDSCRNPKNLYTTECDGCHKEFCLAHRHREDHECPFTVDLNNRNKKKVNKSATSLLAKLRAKNPDRKQRRAGRQARRAERKGSTSSSSARTSVNRIKTRMQAQGDENIEESDRFYLTVTYPRSRTSKKTRDIIMWFKNSWKVGKVIDIICDKIDLENRNNQSNAKKLRLYSTRTPAVEYEGMGNQTSVGDDGNNMMEFPWDVPLKLLQPALVSGDSVALRISGV